MNKIEKNKLDIERLAEQTLQENVIGVNLEKLKTHWDFKPSIIKAMIKFAKKYEQKVQD